MRVILLLLAVALPPVAARAADDLLADLRQEDAAIATRVSGWSPGSGSCRPYRTVSLAGPGLP